MMAASTQHRRRRCPRVRVMGAMPAAVAKMRVRTRVNRGPASAQVLVLEEIKTKMKLEIALVPPRNYFYARR